jgi:hypothetical protein
LRMESGERAMCIRYSFHDKKATRKVDPSIWIAGFTIPCLCIAINQYLIHF